MLTMASVGSLEKILTDKNILWNVKKEFNLSSSSWKTILQKEIPTFQDSNDNHDIALLREFHDVYYLTKEVSISPTTSSVEGFSKDKQPLPDIGSTRSASSQVTNIFNKVNERSHLTRLLVLATIHS